MIESDRFASFKGQILKGLNQSGYEVVSNPNIVSTDSNKFTTFETLIKGNHPDLGIPFSGITGTETRVFFTHYDLSNKKR